MHWGTHDSIVYSTCLGIAKSSYLIYSISSVEAVLFCSATSVANWIKFNVWWKKLLVAATATSLPTLM